MMLGTYGSNPALRAKADAERAARVQTKRELVAARLEAMKAGR